MESANQSSAHRIQTATTPPRRRCATPLAWLFTALALLCFAPANAIAQTLGTDDLALGIVSGVNLNLILPITSGGKIYYYVDDDGDGTAQSPIGDAVQHSLLDTLFNNGTDTVDTQEGDHDGADDARSVIVDGYTLILPTVAELTAFANDSLFDTLPDIITTGAVAYNVWAADDLDTPVPDMHKSVNVRGPALGALIADSSRAPVFFEVQVAPTPVTFDITIPTQTYPRMTPIAVTLPAATGGSGTLAYTQTGTLPTGLVFDATARTITGTGTELLSTSATDIMLTYTVTDSLSVPQTSAQTFTLKRVAVTIDDGGNGTLTYNLNSDLTGAIAVNNVGGTSGSDNNNDMRLILPESHAATTFTVTTYTPSDPPPGVTFSVKAMDIALTAGTLAADTTATVCLSTEGVTVPTGARLMLYRLPTATAAWELIGNNIYTYTDFVCGITDEFSPFAIGYGVPTTLDFGTISSQIFTDLVFLLTTDDGKTYHTLGTDAVNTLNHDALDIILNGDVGDVGDNDTTVTQEGAHDGSDDARSTFRTAESKGEHTLILPTIAELKALVMSPLFPKGGAISTSTFWSADGADPAVADMHQSYNISTMTASTEGDGTSRNVIFQIRRPPIVFNPATISNQIYRINTAISVTLPTASTGDDGPELSYTLTDDSIPGLTFASIPGLTFDPETRTLAGTPTTETDGAVTYTYTAIDDTMDMESLIFTVAVNVVVLVFDTSTIPAPAYTYPAGTAITPLTLPPASGGIGELTYTLAEDFTPGMTFASLPGLTFDPETRTLAGTPTTETDEPVPLIYTAIDNTAAMESLTFTVTVVPGTNTTRLNEQILTRASQTMTASTMAAVAARVGAVADGGGAGIAGTTGAGTTPTLAYQFGGQSSLRGLLESHGKAMLEGEMEYERLLDDASFVLPLSATDGNKHGANTLSLWGSTDYRSLDGDADGLDWDGDVRSLHLGIDGQFSQQIMAGIALSLNESSFDYKDAVAGDDGEYQYRSTNLHPYIGWYPTDEWKLWATLGYGQGDIENDTDSGTKDSTDSTQLSLSGGFSNQLPISSNRQWINTTSWSLKGDVSLVQVAVDEGDGFDAEDIDSQRLRLLVSGEQNHKTTSGGVLTPSLEVGVRSDGGDGENGTGVELGGGLRYSKPGGALTVAGNIRTLLANSAYSEYGADFSVRLSPRSGRGLSLSLNPVWGETQSAAERLWDDGINQTAGGDTALHGSVDTEVGYGMAATMLGSPGLLTPYAGMIATDDGNRLRLGSRFAGGNGLSLNLEGTQKNTTDGASHQVLLRGEVSF